MVSFAFPLNDVPLQNPFGDTALVEDMPAWSRYFLVIRLAETLPAYGTTNRCHNEGDSITMSHN